MLRVKPLPVEPISGSLRSFQRPSGRRAVRASGGGSSAASVLISSEVSKRFMSRRSSRSDSRFSPFSDVVGSRYHGRFSLILLKTACMARFGSDRLTGGLLGTRSSHVAWLHHCNLPQGT